MGVWRGGLDEMERYEALSFTVFGDGKGRRKRGDRGLNVGGGSERSSIVPLLSYRDLGIQIVKSIRSRGCI